MHTSLLETMLRIETAADEWWSRLTRKEQEVYLRAHPNSKFANSSTPGSTPRPGVHAGMDSVQTSRDLVKKFGAKHAADSDSDHEQLSLTPRGAAAMHSHLTSNGWSDHHHVGRDRRGTVLHTEYRHPEGGVIQHAHSLGDRTISRTERHSVRVVGAPDRYSDDEHVASVEPTDLDTEAGVMYKARRLGCRTPHFSRMQRPVEFDEWRERVKRADLHRAAGTLTPAHVHACDKVVQGVSPVDDEEGDH